jgi:hypothetical protein
MRSVEDRQRVEQLSEVREVFDHLHGTANIVIRLYHEVGAFHAVSSVDSTREITR